MTEEWQGVVKHIIFVNESTAYSVFRMEISELHESITCLLYTSDAADDSPPV